MNESQRIEIDPAKYMLTRGENGKLIFDPVVEDCDWVPKEGELAYVPLTSGIVYRTINPDKTVKFHKKHAAYPTKEMAQIAAPKMTRANAIIRAGVLVEPDADEKIDWDDIDQKKWRVMYSHAKKDWLEHHCFAFEVSPYHHTTPEKARAAAKLLTKWGVK